MTVFDYGSLAAVRRQKGITLIVGLILLLVMTMLGLTAVQVTTQQERMAGNLRDRNIAFQAAESALREGESALIRCVIDFNGNGAFDVEANSVDALALGALAFIASAATAEWTEDNSFLFDDFDDACTEPKTHGVFFQAAVAPRFFLERQPPVGGSSLEVGVSKDIQVTKVTSRGVGGQVTKVKSRGVGGSEAAVVVSEAAVVVLQSSFKMK